MLQKVARTLLCLLIGWKPGSYQNDFVARENREKTLLLFSCRAAGPPEGFKKLIAVFPAASSSAMCEKMKKVLLGVSL